MGVVLCGLVPLLPVKQTTATIVWPQGPAANGLISDITAPLVSGATQPGLSARIDVDSRFITTPTPLKLGVMVLGVICVLGSIVALAVLDRQSGRRVRDGWRRFWRVSPSTWLADIGVVGTLLLWHI